MEVTFPKGLYADVRIEHMFSTEIIYTFRNMDECREKRYSAAFIRVYDGTRWYYASTSDLNAVQSELDALARLAQPNVQIESDPLYPHFSAHRDKVMAYTGREVSAVALEDKIAFLQRDMPLFERNAYVCMWRMVYLDKYKITEFYNSKGAQLKHDYQTCGFSYQFQMKNEDGERQFRESFSKGRTEFSQLDGFKAEMEAYLAECQNFLLHSVAVEPGTYAVVLSPVATGVFAHECFGHKSESDFMVGDEETKKEWALGKRVGGEGLSIIETGTLEGSGYVPYDDEGNKAGVTYLVRDGILTGRLHNAASAADLEETVTGNARAINYEFEPIVRMTTTYIDKGAQSVEELIAETGEGIYVKEIFHGSGMSTFTLAPSLAYYIKDGKIGQPVRISVVTGNVFEALGQIDGFADDLELLSFVTGGCGKMDQYPLSVGMGGPHIRVRGLNVQ